MGHSISSRCSWSQTERAPGDPYGLRNTIADGVEAEINRETKQSGATVYFDRPVLADYANGTMVHVAAIRSTILRPSVRKQVVRDFRSYGYSSDYSTEYTSRQERHHPRTVNRSKRESNSSQGSLKGNS